MLCVLEFVEWCSCHGRKSVNELRFCLVSQFECNARVICGHCFVHPCWNGSHKIGLCKVDVLMNNEHCGKVFSKPCWPRNTDPNLYNLILPKKYIFESLNFVTNHTFRGSQNEIHIARTSSTSVWINSGIVVSRFKEKTHRLLETSE